MHVGLRCVPCTLRPLARCAGVSKFPELDAPRHGEPGPSVVWASLPQCSSLPGLWAPPRTAIGVCGDGDREAPRTFHVCVCGQPAVLSRRGPAVPPSRPRGTDRCTARTAVPLCMREPTSAHGHRLWGLSLVTAWPLVCPPRPSSGLCDGWGAWGEQLTPVPSPRSGVHGLCRPSVQPRGDPVPELRPPGAVRAGRGRPREA